MTSKIYTIIALLATLSMGAFAEKKEPAPSPETNTVNALLKQLPGKLGKAKVANVSALSVNKPSDIFPAIVNLCKLAYPTDPNQQQQCIADIDSQLIAKGVFAGKLPYGRYAVFPVQLDGIAVGTCLYLQSPYVFGVACYGTSAAGTGGAYAGCDIYNGCGSGYF